MKHKSESVYKIENKAEKKTINFLSKTYFILFHKLMTFLWFFSMNQIWKLSLKDISFTMAFKSMNIHYLFEGYVYRNLKNVHCPLKIVINTDTHEAHTNSFLFKTKLIFSFNFTFSFFFNNYFWLCTSRLLLNLKVILNVIICVCCCCCYLSILEAKSKEFWHMMMECSRIFRLLYGLHY